MPQSILDSTKKTLGLDPSYTAFDTDIIIHINSVFSDLNQLGVGPDNGFSIDDNSETWEQFLPDQTDMFRLGNVKSYMYLRVRMLFDPPDNGSIGISFEKQIEKLEWRMNVAREEKKYPDPDPTY